MRDLEFRFRPEGRLTDRIAQSCAGLTEISAGQVDLVRKPPSAFGMKPLTAMNPERLHQSAHS